MNVDHPHLRTARDQQEPDYLAGAVLLGLGRPIGEKAAWSLFRTLVLGVVSFGLLPILYWPKRFRQFVDLEQQQLWHLAEWLRLHVRHPDAIKLREDVQNIRFRSDLWLLSSLSMAFVGVIFFTQLRDYYFNFWPALLDSTYLYAFHPWHPTGAMLAGKLFKTWTVGLGAAYTFHWAQIHLHASSVRRFILRFNVIARSEGLTAIVPVMPRLRPLWVMAALMTAGMGAIWGVPMMLAGAAQNRIVRTASTRNRAAMAHRLRAMLLARRPMEEVPVPMYLRHLCANEHCRAPVHQSARFCPRCGSRIVPALHRVA